MLADSDLLSECPGCLHPREVHVVDGCTARDPDGNRCACVEPAHW